MSTDNNDNYPTYYSGNMSKSKSKWDINGGNDMIIEAVVVCYNYSDFLEHTLPRNLDLVDRLVVVTHHNDRKTQLLCQKYSVDCLKTNIFHDDGDVFNKGRAINLGLAHLRHTGWVLHLDADIMLPPRFRHMLHMAKLDPKNIYGCDRLNVVNYENWTQHKHKTSPQHAWRYLVCPQVEFPIGARLVHLEYGFCPLGFFQLFHSSLRRTYPIVCGSAEHSDVLFAVQWDRQNRILLPEFFVYHLESEKANPRDNNWEGRITKEFGPDDKADPFCRFKLN